MDFGVVHVLVLESSRQTDEITRLRTVSTVTTRYRERRNGNGTEFAIQ